MECHCRPLQGSSGTFIAMYERLADQGLAPRILAVSAEVLCTVRHPTLGDWLNGIGFTWPTKEQRQAMGRRLYERIMEMHSHGICHRDLHIDNIVLADGHLPLFVDPDFAVESDPNAPCYDLVGPDLAGLPVPGAHATQRNGNEHGVWWDSAGPVPTLASRFGPYDQFA